MYSLSPLPFLRKKKSKKKKKKTSQKIPIQNSLPQKKKKRLSGVHSGVATLIQTKFSKKNKNHKKKVQHTSVCTPLSYKLKVFQSFSVFYVF